MPYKTLKRCVLWLLYLNCGLLQAHAQYFEFTSSKKKQVIPFRMVRNLVVVQLKINNKGPFNFIMDTGVELMVITDSKLLDSVPVPNKRIIKLGGLGENEDYDAYTTSLLQVDLPGITSRNVYAAILKSDHLGLSNYTGMSIQGLLGYEFFSNLAVKVDFSDSTLTVYRPTDRKLFDKGEAIPITIENNKPFLEANVYFPCGEVKKSKLIVDLGAGHPLSLENLTKTEEFPKKSIPANLGEGFSGPIYGYISRITEVELGKYKIKNPISSFPDNDSLQLSKNVKRDGNLGIGLLKKFIVVFDYSGKMLYLKPSPEYDTPFEHDMSGLEYYACGDGLKRVLISRVEAGSAGDEIGLEQGDEILTINLKPTAEMSLEEIDKIFKSQNNRNLLLGIYHDKKYDQVIITLRRRI